MLSISHYHPAGSFERQLRDYKVKLAVTAVRETMETKQCGTQPFHFPRLPASSDPPCRARPDVRPGSEGNGHADFSEMHTPKGFEGCGRAYQLCAWYDGGPAMTSPLFWRP